MRGSRILGVLLAATAGFWGGCGRHVSNAEAGIATQTLLVGNAAEPADLDPGTLYAWTDNNICNALFEGLTESDEATGRALPAGASRWDISADGKVYTFHLRPEAKWSDGQPVTASDYVYGIRRQLTPAFASIYSYMLWPIRNAEAYNAGRITDFSQVGIKALNPVTLEVTLAKPTPYLAGMTVHPTWFPIPEHVVEKFGTITQKGTRWTRPGNLVGNGPFVLKQWRQNSDVSVEKNPLYWDAAHVRLHRIIFYPIENADTEEFAFRAGQLDLTYLFPVGKLEGYRKDHPEELKIEDLYSTYFLFFNVTRPPLDNPKVRRALSMAVDRVAICRDVLRKSRSPGYTYTPPDMVGYTCRTKMPSDFDAARRLLAEAGYPGGKGLPPFEAISYQSEASIQTLEAIQAQWAREIGVHLSILPQEQKTLFQNSQDGNYTIAFSAWIADYADPYTFLGTMVTGGGNNWARWSNKEYDRLIEDSTNTADNARRYEDFQKAEALIIREAPLCPLFYGQHPFAMKTWVKGYPLSRLGFHRWKNVYLER